MIRLENANLGDRVLTFDMLEGVIYGFHVSDSNRVYVEIKLDDEGIIARPLDMCNKLNF